MGTLTVLSQGFGPGAVPPKPPEPRYGGAAKPGLGARLLRKPAIPLLLILIIAGGVGAVVIADDDDAAPTRHVLNGQLRGVLLAHLQLGPPVGFAGTAEQTPGGSGAFSGDLTLLGDPTSLAPVPMQAMVTERFDSGRLDINITGSVQFLTKDGSKRIVKGTGTIVGRTGEFKGAKGTASISARAETATSADFTLKGSLTF